MREHYEVPPSLSVQGGYGHAVTDVYEGTDGTMWVSNGEYASQVNFCPFRGTPARTKIDETVDHHAAYLAEQAENETRVAERLASRPSSMAQMMSFVGTGGEILGGIRSNGEMFSDAEEGDVATP